MKLLLDTHALMWFFLADPQLSAKARSLIVDAGNHVLVSPASYWEIAIKISIGRYTITQDLAVFVEREIAKNGFEIVPIMPVHASIVARLPFHHKDPFDRLLVAQTQAEQASIVSADEVFDKYGVPRLW